MLLRTKTGKQISSERSLTEEKNKTTQPKPIHDYGVEQSECTGGERLEQKSQAVTETTPLITSVPHRDFAVTA